MAGAGPPTQGLAALARVLLGTDRAVLVSHRSPDGDTVGSALALAGGLRALGKDVMLVCDDPIPPGLRFLEGWEAYQTTLDGAEEADAFVAIDCADVTQMGQVGPAVLRLSASGEQGRAERPLLNLDHHGSNTLYGTMNVVDAASASVAEMVYLLLQELGVPPSPAGAQALLTGVINDTHSFQNSNATPQSLRLSAALIEAGADVAAINDHLFRSRRLQAALLWRHVFTTLSLDEGNRVASLQVTSTALNESGADPRSDTDGMVDFLKGIIGVELAIVLKQGGPSSSKASLRTSGAVDAVVLAQRFGGGGHRRAAGCDIPLPPAAALAALLDAYREVRRKG